MIDERQPSNIALKVASALASGAQITPFSAQYPDFDIANAYDVLVALRAMRLRAGDILVGRKIGFTNKAVMETMGISDPMVADMFNTTVFHDHGQPILINRLSAPRIEPEIVLGLRSSIHAQASLDDIANAVEWMALGFEIVQSIYPNWVFTAPDAIAGAGMHGFLFVGKKHMLSDFERKNLDVFLSGLDVTLSCDGKIIADGHGNDVLGGPIKALQKMSEQLADLPDHGQLQQGEIVTTGSLTEVPFVKSDQEWTFTASGNFFAPLSVRLK